MPTDQRGAGYPRIVGASVDMGAYELQNTAPVAKDDSFTTNEDTALAGNVLTNDTDAQMNQLSATLVSAPANAASFTLNSDGTFSYTPNANFNGMDSFTYKVSDGSLDSNTATVTITVAPVNDAPTITAAGGISRQQNFAPTRSQIATVSDVDNPLSALSVKVNGAASATANGVTVSNILIDANGNVTANIATTAAATTASFTLTVSDGSLSSTATLTVTVLYRFTGFFAPISNTGLNSQKAGSAIPIKFSLNGYKGLNIFATGSPSYQPINCSTGAVIGAAQMITSAGASGLSYDTSTDQYQINWKTDKTLAGTCQRLNVTLNDGTTHTADFQFK